MFVKLVFDQLDEAPSSLTLVAVVLASSGERLVTWRASFPLIIGFYHEGVDKVHLSQSASTYLFEVFATKCVCQHSTRDG